jgi:hypothetical protein
MRVEEILQSKGSGWLIRLREKGGKPHAKRDREDQIVRAHFLVQKTESIQRNRMGQATAPPLEPSMSEKGKPPVSEKLRPAFGQTFEVTVHPSHPRLPELSLVWLPRSTDDPETELYSLSADFDDDVGPPTLELRDFTPTNTSIVDTLLAWHLKVGLIGPFGLDDPDYFKVASIIRDTAEIPVKTSPLKGITLTTLLGGGGSAAVLEVFHNGVTPAEATVSVLFVAGAMILLGTANAVRRAVEAGLERKLLLIFGVEPDKTIAKDREHALRSNKATSRAKEERARSATLNSAKKGDATTDAYAMRNPRIAAARERESGLRTGDWHGDPRVMPPHVP